MIVRMKKSTARILAAFAMLTLLAAIAVGEPGGPNDIVRGEDSRANLSGIAAAQVLAQAGNVTQLTINATIVTNSWQGYYGNITGAITLENGESDVLYDWAASDTFSPVGEIYAANDTVSNWADVICVQLTGNGTINHSGINVTQLEEMFGMNETDGDGFDETFTSTQEITVDTNTLTGCPSTHMYVGNTSQTAVWNESLLTENATGTVIFATEVDQNAEGFNGLEWDFQMIVAEDGSVTTPTTYNFYVELA